MAPTKVKKRPTWGVALAAITLAVLAVGVFGALAFGLSGLF